MELWKECAAWLAKFNVIPPHSRMLMHNATLSDFVAGLRDGVVLCQLVHSMDPQSIDMTRVLIGEDATGRGVSDFLCRHNIFLFLHAVISNFHLNMDEHFFQPEMLYQCQDIAKVLRTLSALSHGPKFRKSGVPGFPKKEKQLTKKIRQEEGIYASFAEMYGEAETEYLYDSFTAEPVTPPKKQTFYGGKSSDDPYEDIYQTICSPRHPRFPLDISFGRKSKRDAPIHELAETEDKYLENLIMVKDCFREKMRLVHQDDLDMIFYRFDDLITLHTDILMGLKMKRANVGKVFLQFLPSIGALYGEYCVNLPQAMELVTSLQEADDKIKNQILQCQMKAKPPTFPLSSHLVLPFQRFLKYHLLLKEILKHTQEDHREYADLKQAVDEMLKIGTEVNERKRQHEESEEQNRLDESALKLIDNVEHTIKLMQLPNGARLSDFGRLRKAGEISGHIHNGKVTDYAFLFDTILLLCQKPKFLQHRYRFKTAIKLKDFFLDPISASPPPGADINSIRLFHRLNPTRLPLMLVARSASERDVWFHSILGAMDTVDPSENTLQKHVLVMTTFPSGVECSQCHKVLAGKFYQGYRCLRCQASLHKPCIGDYGCLEFGTLKKSDSMSLPTAISESLERSDSSLSLAPPEKRQSGRNSQQLQEWQHTVLEEMERTPIEQQSWYAGELAPKIATTRLQNLPIGTYLIRKRVNGSHALALKTAGGVKHMCIQARINPDSGKEEVFFSDAIVFGSIQKMVSYYRARDLTDNFNYADLKGVCLKMPFKDI